MSVEFSREKMSVEFSRDPDVENAAVNLMGMSAEQVKRMRLVDVRELVKNRVEQEHALEEHGSAVEDVVLPAPQPRTPPRMQPPPLLAREQMVMTASEVGLVDPLAGSAGIRQVMATIPESDDELKGLDFLLTPLNVNAWCVESDGLTKLTKHVHRVLEVATDLEQAVREKHSILGLHKAVLDAEDIEEVHRSIQVDARQLAIIFKWLSAVLDDIAQHIRMRLEVQSKYQNIRRGSTTKLCDKMHAKSLKLRALHNAISARCECLQIPKLIQAATAESR